MVLLEIFWKDDGKLLTSRHTESSKVDVLLPDQLRIATGDKLILPQQIDSLCGVFS